MTKREREALREYVEAVAAHTRSVSALPEPTWAVTPVDGPGIAHDITSVNTGAWLNAADDRLRALGMLP